VEERVKKQFLKQLRPGMTKEQMEKVVLGIYGYGRAAGKLAGWYIRWYKKRPVVYKLPKDYHISQTNNSILNRNSFGAATNIAKVLIKIPALKEVWNKADVDGNCAYRKLIKYNKKRLVNNLPSVNISLTPDDHHFVSENSLSFNKNSIILNNDITAVNDSLIVVLAVFDPLDKRDAVFEFMPVSNFKLTEEQQAICQKYKKYILYSAEVMKTGDELFWSNTAADPGEFIIARPLKFSDIIEFRGRRSEVGRTEIRGRRSEVSRKKAHPPPGEELYKAA